MKTIVSATCMTASRLLYIVMLFSFIPLHALDRVRWTVTHGYPDNFCMSASLGNAYLPQVVADAQKLAVLRSPFSPYEPGKYTAQIQLEHQRRLAYLEKSICRNDIQAMATVSDIREARLVISKLFAESHVGPWYASRKNSLEDYVKLAAADTELQRYDSHRYFTTHWNPLFLFGYMLMMYVINVFVSLILFSLKAIGLGVSPFKLIFEFEKTTGAAPTWIISYWCYPTCTPIVFARAAMNRLAILTSLAFSMAPAGAMGQGKKMGDKRQDAPTAQIAPAPECMASNALVVGGEVTTIYHGSLVGEYFGKGPAPRNWVTYIHRGCRGVFSANLWNSFGAGSNRETNAALLVSSRGWNASFAHMFIGGGNLRMFTVGKSGEIRAGRIRAAVGTTLMYFQRVGSNSPPGGVISKNSVSFTHRVWGLSQKLRIRHQFELGVDNNPFGLGDGVTGVGFYRGQANFGSFYGGVLLSRPLLGADNTTRGPRHSFFAGWSHEFALQ